MNCPACKSEKLKTILHTEDIKDFRCIDCNIRFIITNPSELPSNVKVSLTKTRHRVGFTDNGFTTPKMTDWRGDRF